MMRQRISSAQTNAATGDSSSTAPGSGSNRPLTARKRSSGRQRQSSSSSVIEEEDAFVGLSGKRSWSSEDFTATSSSAYYQQPNAAQSTLASPPLSGGFLMQSSTAKNNNNNSIFYQQQFSDPPPSLQDFHVTYRNALHVPDNRYEAYVLGYAHRRRDPPIVTKVCCAHTCLGFSTVGFIFLIWVGIMLDTQPLLIKGSLPQQLVADQDTGKPILSYRLPEPGERLPTASTAYHAALCYFCCIIACIYILHPQWIQSKIYRFRNRYEDVDQNNHHHLPQTTQTLNQSQDEIELGDMGHKMRSPAWWNHIMMNGKHWLAAKGLYKPDTQRRRAPNAKTV